MSSVDNLLRSLEPEPPNIAAAKMLSEFCAFLTSNESPKQAATLAANYRQFYAETVAKTDATAQAQAVKLLYTAVQYGVLRLSVTPENAVARLVKMRKRETTHRAFDDFADPPFPFDYDALGDNRVYVDSMLVHLWAVLVVDARNYVPPIHVRDGMRANAFVSAYYRTAFSGIADAPGHYPVLLRLDAAPYLWWGTFTSGVTGARGDQLAFPGLQSIGMRVEAGVIEYSSDKD
jgi:hypothetical protein